MMHNDFYRIILALFLLFVIILFYPAYSPLFASDKVYTIQTKYGNEQVVVPEGYSETDVLLQVSTAYYEQNHDLKELESKVYDLTSSAEKYIQENKELRSKYETMITDYDVLLKKVQSYNKMGGFVRGFVGGHYNKGVGDNPNKWGFGIDVGGLFFNKVLLNFGANYPWSFTFGASYLFD